MIYTDKGQSILATARKLFSKNGYKATTTKEIANEANVNDVTIFRLFGTKQILLEKMLDYYVSEPDKTDLACENGINLEGYLTKVGKYVYEVFEEYNDIFTIELFEMHAIKSKYQISRLPNEIREIVKQQIVESFGFEVHDADTFAAAYISSIHGLCINCLYLKTWDPPVDLDKCIQIITKNFSSSYPKSFVSN